MAKTRTSTGKSGESVLGEYNQRCSIRGSDRPQLHHIDEDPSNQDPQNLLPLCPNCHLRDQHNPTAAVNPGLLRLFRLYKDPVILLPQFLPLFRRMTFLYEADSVPAGTLPEAAGELVNFVSELEMGRFYAGRITERLNFPQSPEIIMLPESEQERRERERRYGEHLADYRRSIDESRKEIERLIVEMLRYQPWHGANTGRA